MSEWEDLTGKFTEMYVEWRRLMGYPPLARTPLDCAVDEATGSEAAILEGFGEWLRAEFFPRLPAPQEEKQ